PCVSAWKAHLSIWRRFRHARLALFNEAHSVVAGWKASLLLSSRELMHKRPLLEYYRCPQEYLDFCVAEPLGESSGYFHFGPALTCYGQTSGYTCPTVNDHLFDASAHVRRHGHTSVVPFDPAQVVDNLRYERYVDHSSQRRWMEQAWIKQTYYRLRPLFPVALRKQFQQIY